MDQPSSGRNGKLGREHQLIFPKMKKLLLTGGNQSHFVFKDRGTDFHPSRKILLILPEAPALNQIRNMWLIWALI